MADRREGRLNQIAGSYAQPMLCREVVKGHQLFAVFLQAQDGLGVLCLISNEEQVKRFLGVFGHVKANAVSEVSARQNESKAVFSAGV